MTIGWESGRVKHELLVIAVITAVVFVFAGFFDLLEYITDFANQHEEYEVDEIVTTGLVLALCLGVFSWRRWRDAVLAGEELERKNSELQTALAEIRRLEGIIPICSFCKKIRNDRGFWDSVESYVQQHTHALMSHSICPDCLKKQYPELDH
ncbi:MAG: hypothetical protein ACOY32_02435 [Thermodesulfobacteriota bacterium]